MAIFDFLSNPLFLTSLAMFIILIVVFLFYSYCVSKITSQNQKIEFLANIIKDFLASNQQMNQPSNNVSTTQDNLLNVNEVDFLYENNNIENNNDIKNVVLNLVTVSDDEDDEDDEDFENPNLEDYNSVQDDLNLDNDSEHLDNDSEHLDNDSEHLDNDSQHLDNVSEHLDNVSEHLDNVSEHLDNVSEHLDNNLDNENNVDSLGDLDELKIVKLNVDGENVEELNNEKHLVNSVNLENINSNNHTKNIFIDIENLDGSNTNNEATELDYKKLQLPKLRNIVVEKGLTNHTDASKMKKHDLLKLLGLE